MKTNTYSTYIAQSSDFSNDDVDSFIYVFCGFDRHTVIALVDHREVNALVEVLDKFYEIDHEVEIEEVKELEIKMVEVLIMSRSTVERRKFGKQRRKPAPRTSKQLVMEME